MQSARSRFVVLIAAIHATLGYHFHDMQDAKPFLIPLRRESVPVKRHNRIVSYKTSYSGLVHVGTPPQEYRVVFDTGSAHLVLPDSKCATDACRNGKKTYNLSQSFTGLPINSKGQVLANTDDRPHVKIGFGTGGITGEFVRDVLCVSPNIGGNRRNISEMYGPPTWEESAANLATPINPYTPMYTGDSDLEVGCVRMNILSATEMSTNPFYYFKFDGILGLGLKSLAVSDAYSYFDVLFHSAHIKEPQFGVFLSEGEFGEESEFAFGGYDKKRILEPLAWNPVAMQYIGYWQVKILAVRVGGELLDVCEDGGCRGVVDTGTSHLGIPAAWKDRVTKAITVNADDLLDCRLASAPTLELELETINITLNPQDYMRRLPLREGITVQSPHGVNDQVQPSAENLANGSLGKLRRNETGNNSNTSNQTNVSKFDVNAPNIVRHCSPRTISVNLSAPVGPKLFILGEPVLHKYYTVYDWERLEVGFAMANNTKNTAQAHDPNDKGKLPDDVELLMQKGRNRKFSVDDDEAMLQHGTEHLILQDDLEDLEFLLQRNGFAALNW